MPKTSNAPRITPPIPNARLAPALAKKFWVSVTFAEKRRIQKIPVAIAKNV
jgi:hypothetical protein